ATCGGEENILSFDGLQVADAEDHRTISGQAERGANGRAVHRGMEAIGAHAIGVNVEVGARKVEQYSHLSCGILCHRPASITSIDGAAIGGATQTAGPCGVFVEAVKAKSELGFASQSCGNGGVRQ